MDKELIIPVWVVILVVLVFISICVILFLMAFSSSSDDCYRPLTKEELQRSEDIEDQYPPSGFGNHTDPPSLR